MGSSPARAVRKTDVDVAPGQYDDGIRFNSNVKSFTIGEKRADRIETTVGPGQYDLERADVLTKTKIANVNMGSSPARAVRKNDTDVSPGQYEVGKAFGSEAKSFRIGEKREQKIETTVGPG